MTDQQQKALRLLGLARNTAIPSAETGMTHAA